MHIRVNDQLKAAAANLANVGLTISDAVRILLPHVAEEGRLPPGLTSTPNQYDQWFKAKVHETLHDPGPGLPLDEAMKRLEAKIK